MADCAYEQLKSGLKASFAGRITAFGGWGSSRSSGRGTSSGGLEGLSRRPVPGQQLVQTRARPALGHTIDDVGEIRVRIESVEPSQFNDRVYVCRTQATYDKGELREAHPAYWAPFVVVGEGAR